MLPSRRELLYPESLRNFHFLIWSTETWGFCQIYWIYKVVNQDLHLQFLRTASKCGCQDFGRNIIWGLQVVVFALPYEFKILSGPVWIKEYYLLARRLCLLIPNLYLKTQFNLGHLNLSAKEHKRDKSTRQIQQSNR